jgi:hypothetical protein
VPAGPQPPEIRLAKGQDGRGIAKRRSPFRKITKSQDLYAATTQNETPFRKGLRVHQSPARDPSRPHAAPSRLGRLGQRRHDRRGARGAAPERQPRETLWIQFVDGPDSSTARTPVEPPPPRTTCEPGCEFLICACRRLRHELTVASGRMFPRNTLFPLLTADVENDALFDFPNFRCLPARQRMTPLTSWQTRGHRTGGVGSRADRVLLDFLSQICDI